MSRVVELPARGRLIVGTDLQGHVEDFDRLEAVFRTAAASDPDGATLVLTGDLVHGPEIDRGDWPDYLGSFFEADSARILERAHALAEAYPGRVHYLLGNHEHAHVGGPVVSKFFSDEAERLEVLMGPERTARLRAWLNRWPPVAYAPSCGLLLLHGAPKADIQSADDLERVPLCPGPGDDVIHDTIAGVLWARTTTSARARAFMRAIDPSLTVAVYGHDVAREGFAIDREPLLCLSTSFGCYDGDKLYLDWDLTTPVASASELARRGLRPLCPEASPVYRSPAAAMSDA
ncbi:MAG: metallophosphoesterase [Myxococcota bacterium]